MGGCGRRWGRPRGWCGLPVLAGAGSGSGMTTSCGLGYCNPLPNVGPERRRATPPGSPSSFPSFLTNVQMPRPRRVRQTLQKARWCPKGTSSNDLNN
jgi:hypothetical protein